MEEQWKIIQEATRYLISNEGKIKSLISNKIMTPSPGGTSPYLMLNLYVGVGVKKSFLVHRLVAKHFVDNPFNKPQVNHKDGNKLNNHFLNLEWATANENIQHCYDTGLKTYRPLHYKGKSGSLHNRSLAIKCVNSGIEYGSISEASRELNINVSTIHYSVTKNQPLKSGLHFGLV